MYDDTKEITLRYQTFLGAAQAIENNSIGYSLDICIISLKLCK